MRIVPSNSGCCGVKYIRDFPHPDKMMSAINREEWDEYNPEGDTTEPDDPYSCIFEGKAPEETAVERLKRFLRFLQETRCDGRVEAYLAPVAVNKPMCGDCNCGAHCAQYPLWRPILLELGWKELPSFHNGNSDNYVGHFYCDF